MHSAASNTWLWLRVHIDISVWIFDDDNMRLSEQGAEHVSDLPYAVVVRTSGRVSQGTSRRKLQRLLSLPEKDILVYRSILCVISNSP